MFADNAVPTVPLIVAASAAGGSWVTKPVTVKSSLAVELFKYQVPVVAPVLEIRNVTVVEESTF